MIKYYNKEELLKAGLDFFGNDLLATNVWINKYALKIDEKFTELTPDDTIRRMAKEIARAELKFKNPLSYKEIYNTLKDFKYFILGGSVLYGLGNENAVSLANCFFIDNQADSYGGIFNTDESLAQLMKRRGGVGITIEHLRPSGAKVHNSAANSTGAISFMNRFSSTTREVAQDGRRGALIITMSSHHPNIMDFIKIKDDLSKITGANISVKLTDEFMKAVENHQDFILHWPVQKKPPVIKEQLPYNKLIKTKEGVYVKRVKADEIFNMLVEMAHKNAEPGVLYWDTIIRESPADCYSKEGFETRGTNPCSELILSSHDSCRLGSLNLLSFVDNSFSVNASFNFGKLNTMARRAQRIMDDIASLEEEKILKIIEKIDNDPESENIKRTEKELWVKILDVLRNGRRTGLGVLGLADVFAAMNITYGSKEATKFAEKIHKSLAMSSYLESVNLAKERGAFPVWDAKKESQNIFINRVISQNFDNDQYNDYLKYGRRNIGTLAIAPTGSLSLLAQVSSGVEPVFQIYYKRRRKINPNEENIKVSFIDENGDSWEEYTVIHHTFVDWYFKHKADDKANFEYCLNYLKELPEEKLKELISQSPWNNSESHDIDYIEKVNMIGGIQKWIDHSISNTANLPEDISIEKVNELYMHAWKAGCKGMTIYREGSRSGVLLSGKEKDEEDFPESRAPKRPRSLEADYYVATSRGIQFAVIIGLYMNKPYEIFAFENPPSNKNVKGKIIKIKKGHYKFINGEFEIDSLELAAEREIERSVTLMASGLLRHGTPIPFVIKTIKKIDENISSFSSAIRRCLSRYIEEEEINGESCPHCNDKLITESGCVRCVNPGCCYEKC